MLRNGITGAEWGEEIMAIEPSAMRGWLAQQPRRRKGPSSEVSGVAIEWDECGMARMGGVALISIEGPLSRVGSWWGGLGYDQILEAHDRAFRSDARGVLQVGHTPGGYVSGMDECAQQIEAMARASGKLLHALSNDMMYSAGYRLALPASKIWTTRAGGVGSVGIIVTRLDLTKLNEEMGVRIETIASGAYKADGSPDVAITKDEIARITERNNHHRDLFFDAVTRSRGLAIGEGDWAKAALFLGEKAVQARLADGVSTLLECVQRLEQETSGPARVQVPAGPRGQQQQAKGKSMEMGMLALALGLAADAKDQEVTARAQALTGLEAYIKRETGKATLAEQTGVIDGWRDSAGKLEATNKELGELRAKDDAREYQALFSKGEAEGKITPANVERVRAKHTTAEGLATFLETALPGVPGRANADVTAGHKGGQREEKAGAGNAAELTYKGKTWDKLTPSEKAALHKEDNALYHEMRNAQKGGA